MTKKSHDRIVRDRTAVRTFHLLYEKCIGLTQTCHAAYDLAEKIHKNRNGKRFYKNYMSFANSRRNYIENIRK